jgi:cytochrome P450
VGAVVDIADPDLYVEAVPHDRFRRLRTEQPLSFHEEEGGSGFWAFVRYEDVVDVGKDWRTFSSAQGSTLEELGDDQLAVRRSMLDVDPPVHTRLRRLVTPGFTPKVVRSYEEAFRLLTREVLAGAFAKGSFDLVEEISKQLPVLWLCRHLGVPEADAGKLIEWTDRMLGQSDPEYREGVEDERSRYAPFGTIAGLEAYEYASQWAAERRARPTDDVMTKILFAEPDGEPLTDDEFKNFFTVLMIAGQEASRHSISHGTLALMEHPDQLERLASDPGLMPTAVEEIIRWATPIYQFRRTATAEVTMHGETIRTGDKVTVWYISADFDESTFDDPTRFDITRSPNDHVAFGKGGPHFCLGAGLARLQVQITFQELVPDLHRLSLAGPVERLRSNFIHGIKHLPVAVDRSA